MQHIKSDIFLAKILKMQLILRFEKLLWLILSNIFPSIINMEGCVICFLLNSVFNLFLALLSLRYQRPWVYSFIRTEYLTPVIVSKKEASKHTLKIHTNVSLSESVSSKWFSKWTGNSAPSGCLCKILPICKPFHS